MIEKFASDVAGGAVMTSVARRRSRMLKAGVQTEFHVYAMGGHGFGLNPNTNHPAVVVTTRHVRLGDWLNERYKP